MAVNRDPNSILAHFSGKLGGFIIKNYGNKTVLSAIPDMSRRKLSPKQKEANQLMKFANKYAKKISQEERKLIITSWYSCLRSENSNEK